MDNFSRNKQNELSFSIIYSFIVLEEMKEKVQKASDAAIAKKEKVIKHIRAN